MYRSTQKLYLTAVFIILANWSECIAATISWTNTAGGVWGAATNWSPNSVPTGVDDAVITNAGTYTVTINVNAAVLNLTVGGLTGTQTVANSFQTLTVNGLGSFETNTVFNLPGGTLDGPGTFLFKGAFAWSGGVMDNTTGGGRTVFTNTASVTINGTTKTFQRRAVDNYTTATWTGGTILAGAGAVWNNQGGSVFDIQGDLAMNYVGFGGFATINNNGTLKKSTGAGVASLVAGVNNNGLATSLSGVLSLDAGGVSGGTFNANFTCVLNFGGGVQMLVAGANFTGGGLHRVNGSGTLNIATLVTLAPSFELANGGTLDGTNTVIFAGPFTWSGGVMDNTGGGGRTVFTNIASVTINGTTKTFQRRAVDNYTTATWSGGTILTGAGAAWNNQGGSVFDVQGDLAMNYVGFGGFATINNNGTLKKSAGAGLASLVAGVNNNGLTTSLSGVLSLDGGGVSGGSFNANFTCVLNFGGGVQMLVAGANFTGGGLHRVNGSGTVNIATLMTIAPAFELANGGTLDGTNSVIFAGPFTWSGGVMDNTGGGGRTVFTNIASVAINGTTKTFQRRAVDNYTTATWSGGTILAGVGAVWNNQGGSIFDVQGDLAMNYVGFGGFATINNNGTLKKSAGAGVASLVAGVNNNGLAANLSGVLSLDGGGVSGGSFNANGTCVLNFGAGVQVLVAGANFTGGGLHRVNGSGTLNIATLMTIAPAFELANGGTLDGTNTVIFAGPFTWSGGVMDNTGGGGRTVFTNIASVAINGTTKTFQRRAVDNYTTASWSAGTILAGVGAVWNNQGGSVFDVQGDLAMNYVGFGGFATFNNIGTLKKSAGAGLASLVTGVNNNGLTTSLSGVLSLDGGGVSGGGFNANFTCVLNFGAGVHVLVTGANFTGGGLHRINGSGTVNIATLMTIAPAFELANGGTLDGTNTVIFAGPFTWSGGVMNSTGGAGRTVFTNIASVTINGTTKTFQRRAVDNYTTATWSGGTILAGVGAVWNNQGGSLFDVQGDLAMNYVGFGNLATFVNRGTLKKSTGLATASLVCVVSNAGTVRSQSGTFDLPQGYIQTGGLTELAGGNYSGALLDIKAGLLTGPGNIAANVSNGGLVAPGTGVGLLSISNTIPQTYSSTTGSVVAFEIGGLAPGTGHDQLRINSSATLAGTLRADLANAFVPISGNTFTVMTFSARSGVFTNFIFPDYDFAVLQTATNVILIASNALPSLTFTAPTSHLVCATFRLQARATDLDGPVTNLLILLDTNVLANIPNPPTTTNVLDVSWDFPGPVTFTARATDNKGAIRETNISAFIYTLPLHVLNLGGKVTNGFKVCMGGEVGRDYEILGNTNLSSTNWVFVGVMESTNGIWRYTDTSATNRPQRYYRAHQLP